MTTGTGLPVAEEVPTMTRSWPLDDWRKAFLAEARRRGLPGAEIAAALAEVDTYCADSGTDPAEAFGEPTEYAAALAQAHRSVDRSPGARRSPWLGAFVAGSTLVGVMALLAGVEAVTGSGTGAVTLGQLVSVLAGVAGMVLVVVLLFRPARRYRLSPDWRFGLLGATAIAVTTVPALVWPQVVARVPGWPLCGIGLLLLTAAWWPLTSGRLLAVRVVDPATGAEAVRAPGRLLGVIRWALPVALLCAVLIAALLGNGGTAQPG